MKLALGTVQFGLDYGLSNIQGKTSLDEVESILDYAATVGIKTLDTAYSYGDSETTLGNFLQNDNFNVVTKSKLFTNLKELNKHDSQDLVDTFHASLEKLKISSVDGLMIHHVNDLFKTGGDHLYMALESLKEQKLSQKIGVSAYTAKEIDLILDRYNIDIIQLPANIFDQRLMQSGHLTKLKKAGVEIHVRSAFLQGLVFLDPRSLSPHFKKYIKHFKSFQEELKYRNLLPETVALGFLAGIEEIDQIICGVNNLTQLKDLVRAYTESNDFSWVKNFAIDDESIINPGNWKI